MGVVHDRETRMPGGKNWKKARPWKSTDGTKGMTNESRTRYRGAMSLQRRKQKFPICSLLPRIAANNEENNKRAVMAMR